MISDDDEMPVLEIVQPPPPPPHSTTPLTDKAIARRHHITELRSSSITTFVLPRRPTSLARALLCPPPCR